MGRKKIHTTSEAVKAARRVIAKRWRLKHPKQWKAIQHQSYLKRKHAKTQAQPV